MKSNDTLYSFMKTQYFEFPQNLYYVPLIFILLTLGDKSTRLQEIILSHKVNQKNY